MALKDLRKVVTAVALELNVDQSDIQSIQRLPGTKTGTIQIGMKNTLARKQWIDASREKKITAGVLLPDIPREVAENRIYVREALTKYTKTLLYNAKAQLNKLFGYIWCRDGKVCVRRESNSKIYYIRSLNDIDQLLKTT
ncbi:unnamed protein product [Arctia plantaginis]|uniref:Uncharacterized protein n=1 Tax=Arctia plantaginis TaxID=874455 RepID=A0A8S0ZNP2_ARCPL|nr:unnamed protein product [Arctia plantaginis]